MSDRNYGGIGGLLQNDTVLWFIILFLLLFWGREKHEVLAVEDNC